MGNNTANLTTTRPYPESPEVARYQCAECGKWERADKGDIRHSKSCESRPQGERYYATAQTASTAYAAPADLARFAARVARTGQTQGRDEDVYEAVRRGLLSQDAAMNRDD